MMLQLPAGPDLLPQAGIRAQRARRSGGEAERVQVYEGEIAIVIGRTAKNISP
jgi:2-keto-4-pentenoate hydratase/2-oxohepta-3-ene-1,7-dioic acid hydratase in catechol pathway